MGGVEAGSPLKHSNATSPAAKVKTTKAGGTGRLGLLPERGKTWAILFSKPVLNRDIPEAREAGKIAVRGNERQSMTLGNSGNP